MPLQNKNIFNKNEFTVEDHSPFAQNCWAKCIRDLVKSYTVHVLEALPCPLALPVVSRDDLKLNLMPDQEPRTANAKKTSAKNVWLLSSYFFSSRGITLAFFQSPQRIRGKSTLDLHEFCNYYLILNNLQPFYV